MPVMTTNPMPKAKTERLIVTQIDGETLVYDRARDAASCLNALAAKVWWQCDGETSVAGIAAALEHGPMNTRALVTHILAAATRLASHSCALTTGGRASLARF